MNKPNQTSHEGMTKEQIPQISISVTMSDGENNEESYSDDTSRSEPSRVSDDGNSTVPSVWAMMENYQGIPKDNSTPSSSPVKIEENESDESSNYHSTEESLGSNTAYTDAENENFGDALGDGLNQIPSGIHFVEDDGELIQNSYYTHEGLDLENSSDRSTINEAEKATIFRQDAQSQVNDQATSYVSGVRSAQGQPTPAKVRQKWASSGGDEEFSMNDDSLMQESLAQSIQMILSQGSGAKAGMPSNLSDKLLDNDSATQLSLSTLPELKNISIAESYSPQVAADLSKRYGEKPNLQIQTQELDSIYSDRLGELESNLRLQQTNTDEVQNRLKKRVMELEQALKVSVATPKGTVVDENPLKILLNRNQTLVKEVRFADQTCVELSSKISELEKRNEELNEKVSALERDNDSLRSRNLGVEPTNALETEAVVERLQNELMTANESLRVKTIEEEQLRRTLDEVLCELNINDKTPGLSFASSMILDKNGVLMSETIQQQVGVLIEKAKDSLQLEKVKQEMHDLRNENIALKSGLLLDQLRGNPEAVPIAIPTEDNDDILKLQKENEFLGRQLGLVQDKLDEAQKRKVNEEHKCNSLKTQLERSAETFERLIGPLETRLFDMTNGNPELQKLADADSRLLLLQKDFILVKDSIATMKREADIVLNSLASSTDNLPTNEGQRNMGSKVRTTISRMAESYKQLELDVGQMTAEFSARLEDLTSTISHLRSSLLFEKESVASEELSTHDAHGQPNNQYNGSSIDLIDAVPVQGEVDGVIEVAKVPLKHDISVTSELDDVSRLLNDDLTLESIVKSVSVLTPMSNMDAFKQSLEAAVNECKRVKERSMELKDQIESHKQTIEQLKQEKQKLALDASRRSEEFSLLERALEEAKEEIDLLRSTIVASQIENENLYEQIKSRERDSKLSKEVNDRLVESIEEIRKEKDTIEARFNECDEALTETKLNLKSTLSSKDEYKKRLLESQSNISKKIENAIEQKELESVQIRRALQVANHEKSELQRLHEDALKRISQEVETKLKLESQVNELQHSKLQAQSDLEDKDLESKFASEDMRKERAELKYQLSQSEKELSSLKESYINLKIKMEEKRQTIQETEGERSDLLSNVTEMSEKRLALINSLVNLGCCEDIVRVMNSKDSDSDRPSALELTMNEIDCWKCVIPMIGDKIESLHHSVATIPKLELEIERLTNDLTNHENKEERDSASQNEKLLDLLRQAEQEMERSTVQIKEMSQAMALMQEREKEANINMELMGSELVKLKNQSKASEFENEEDFAKVKTLLINTSTELEKKENQIIAMTSEINRMQSEIEEMNSLLRSKESEENSLKANIESSENKNTRLREYIRKLTAKCEEWEVSYDRQSRAIDRLQEKKTRMKERTADIASRYRALVTDINRRKKLHKNDRERWSLERSNLNSVHAALERELEQIAKELA